MLGTMLSTGHLAVDKKSKVPALMEGEKQASIDECYEKKIKNKIWW